MHPRRPPCNGGLLPRAARRHRALRIPVLFLGTAVVSRSISYRLTSFGRRYAFETVCTFGRAPAGVANHDGTDPRHAATGFGGWSRHLQQAGFADSPEELSD